MSKPKGYWSKTRCYEEALKFSTKAEFRRHASPAYSIAKRNGWNDDICSHMKIIRRSNGYWNKEECTLEAQKFTARTAFSKHSPSAYNAAKSNGWLDDICSRMRLLSKPAGYWTKERCEDVAAKYSTRRDFLKNDASAFRIAQRNGWLNDICGHMQRLMREAGYWTKPRLIKIAKKYATRNDFHLGDDSAYRTAQARGLLDEICAHMEYQVLPRNYWTKERVVDEARQFLTRGEFMNASAGAYSRAQLEGWLDEVCEHMEVVDHGWLHCIYAITNKRLNRAYIGLTRQVFDVRMQQHKGQKNTTKSAVIANEADTIFVQLTPYQYDVNEVVTKEKEFIELYARNDWTMLNAESHIGRIGSQTKWTYEKCAEQAMKFTSKADFRKSSPKAYSSANRRGFLSELCVHMTESKKPNGYWSKEKCLEEAYKFNRRNDFKASAAYQAALRNGWLDYVTQHIPRARKGQDTWTKAECAEQARKYKNRTSFTEQSRGAYTAAKNNRWLDDICSHMQNGSRVTWSFETCRIEAQKYKTRAELKREKAVCYSAARRAGWLEEICQHMKSTTKPSGFWTPETCAEEASKHTSKQEFLAKAGGAYQAAKRGGWLDTICKHMASGRVPRGYWNIKENCQQAALKCSSRAEFKSLCRGAYRSAEKHLWLAEICAHMSGRRKSNGYLLNGIQN